MKLNNTIGKGAFGSVEKCVHKSTGREAAVKVLRKENFKKKELEMIVNEISIIKELDHPNILRIYEAYESKEWLYIVTELITGGELFDEISKRQNFTEADAAIIIKQILEAVSYWHGNNIVHKDLKPENLMLQEKDNVEYVKVIDFGTAQKFNPEMKMNKVIGTPYYVAPEVLQGNYDEKWDIWSIGVIMYILLSGEPPFNGEDDNEILAKVKIGDYNFSSSRWRNISKHAKDLIKLMLSKEPEKRIKANEALKHEWFANMKKKNNKKDSAWLKNTLKDLENFRIEQKMQQAALTYMANHLVSEEELKTLNNAFKALDVDNNGKLSKEELLAGYKNIKGNLTKEQLEEIFEIADADKSGQIDYSEWVLAAANKNKLLSIENLKWAFRMFDQDGSGKISHEELKSVLGGHHTKVGEKFWREMIEEVDQNGDGEIDFDEFVFMMTKLCKQNPIKEI